MYAIQKKFVSLSLLVSVLALFAGCGSSESSSTAPAGGTALSSFLTGTAATTWCGSPAVYTNGTKKCAFSLIQGTPFNPPPGLPMNTLMCTSGVPCPPSGLFSYGVGSSSTAIYPKLGSNSYGITLSVQAGDTLVFQGSGSYGKAGDSWFGSNDNCTDGNITQTDLSANSGTVFHGVDSLNNPLPAALMAKLQYTAGGTDYFNLGDSGIVQVTSPGLLSWGLNSPDSHNCFYLNIQELQVQRCVDVSGNSVVCPQP